MNPDPTELNRIGLILNTISGLLLIPEVLSKFPLDRIENSIEVMLNNISKLFTSPILIHPKSWQRIYSEEQRANVIEPLTAFPTLLFSTVWITVLLGGIVSQSRFLILFACLLPSYVSLLNIQRNWKMPNLQVKNWRIKVILTAIVSIFLLAGPFSLIRVLLFLLKKVVHRIQQFFASHNVVRSSILFFAISMFILSNILQLWATFLE